MSVIGITGSIASGKSALRDLLAPLLPAAALDADLIARSLLENDAGVRARVAAEISPHSYQTDGSANRLEIRRIIYSDPAAKSRLEAILHPLVRAAWTDAASLARKEQRHLLVDIPLLFETNAAGHFDFVITIACSPEVQMARLAGRGMDPDLARNILATQMPAAEKISRSTHVIWNDGDLAALEAQAREFARLVAEESPGVSP
jgi:dephospho-CoA kinase